MLSDAKHLTYVGWISKELRMFYLPVRGPSLRSR
jgi:hypothetical protein